MQKQIFVKPFITVVYFDLGSRGARKEYVDVKVEI